MKYPVKDYGAFKGIWQRQREMGFKPPIGAGDVFIKSLYSAMHPCAHWDPLDNKVGNHGGVFNLEFSPEGSLLVAACEKKSILLLDPLTHKKVHFVSDAHTDCVNCVKFLDSRMFATCSDDTTIALWDIRNLNQRIRTLQGHSNWVKNIEFSNKDNLLVTSGLDGSICTWDIDCYTETSFVYQRVFHAAGLMRCRISPDANQLVMCTTGGLLIIIHDLDLSTLAQDLQGFKPNMYRLMQVSGQELPIACNYNYLFDRRRKHNRVEFICDFPEGNDAEVVSSLQIHPHGWCALSRNISHDDRSEWTCIHDIQEDHSTNDEADEEEDEVASSPSSSGSWSQRDHITPSAGARWGGVWARAARRDGPSRGTQPVATYYDRGTSMAAGQDDVWEALISLRQHRIRLDHNNRGLSTRGFSMQRITGISTGIAAPLEERSTPARRAVPTRERNNDTRDSDSRISPSTSGSTQPMHSADETSSEEPEPSPTKHNLIHMNKPRLLFYVQEPNLGKGFIKELCFSADGRLICSPYGYGIRLLSLSENCSELPYCVPPNDTPVPLTDLKQCIRHTDLVVSSKFSPRHCMLVTGCLGGRIVWYQPYC